jgi:hypothetical protein
MTPCRISILDHFEPLRHVSRNGLRIILLAPTICRKKFKTLHDKIEEYSWDEIRQRYLRFLWSLSTSNLQIRSRSQGYLVEREAFTGN